MIDVNMGHVVDGSAVDDPSFEDEVVYGAVAMSVLSDVGSSLLRPGAHRLGQTLHDLGQAAWWLLTVLFPVGAMVHVVIASCNAFQTRGRGRKPRHGCAVELDTCGPPVYGLCGRPRLEKRKSIWPGQPQGPELGHALGVVPCFQ